jgi:hypothetical protein
MAGKSGASAAVLALKKAAGTAIKKAKKVEARQGGQFPGVPAGTYEAKITSAKFDQDKNKKPYFTINLAIDGGPFNGKRGSVFHGLSAGQTRTIEQALEWCFADLKTLGFTEDDLEAENLPAIAEQLTEDKPSVQIRLQPPKTEGFDMRVYINSLLEGSAALGEDEEPIEDEEEVAEEEEETTEEEGEEETVEEEEETVEEEEEPFVPELKKKYKCVVPGSKKPLVCTVVGLNRAKGLCKLKKPDGTFAENIPFDKIGDEA